MEGSPSCLCGSWGPGTVALMETDPGHKAEEKELFFRQDRKEIEQVAHPWNPATFLFPSRV